MSPDGTPIYLRTATDFSTDPTQIPGASPTQKNMHPTESGPQHDAPPLWANDEGSVGIGLTSDMSLPRYEGPVDMSTHPTTGWESAKANFQLGIDSDWNLTSDAYHGMGWLYDRTFHGAQAAHDYYESVKGYRKALTDTVERLPTQKQSWLNGWAPKLLGSMLDPATIGIAKVGEVGIKLVAPEALSSLTAAAGIGGGSLSLSQKIMKGAIEGSAGATIGGAVSGLGGVAASKAMGDKVTFGDYLKNTLMWTGMGALGGGIGSAVGHYLYDAGLPPEHYDSPHQAEVDISNVNLTSQPGVENAADTVSIQHNASSSYDASTPLKAALNESIDEVERKQKIYNHMDPQTIKADNIRSPYEQLQDRVDTLSDKKQSLSDEASDVLNEIKQTYSPGENISESKKFSDATGGLGLTRLLQTMKALPALKDNLSAPNDLVDELHQGLRANSYNVGAASRVRSALNEDPYLVHPDDKELVRQMHIPEKELEEIDKYNKPTNEKHALEVEKRRANLKKFIQKSPTQRIKDSGLSDSLRRLNRISQDLDEVNDYHEIAKNTQTSLMGPKEDLETSAINTAYKINDPSQSMDQEGHSMSLEDFAKDNRPYSEDENTIGEMDNAINELKSQDMLKDEDLKEVATIDEAARNDEGERSIIRAIKHCILENG